MLVEHGGAAPAIDETATVAPTAVISGDVRIGPHTVVLPGAVITAEGAPVRIGGRCVIMENAVIRGAGIHKCTIGDHVLVAPHSHISGATVGRCSFVATGASILNGAVVDEGSIIDVHAVVHLASHVAAGTRVPLGHVALGNPAVIYAPGAAIVEEASLRFGRFAKAVFGIDTTRLSDSEATREICERYTTALTRHRHDQPLE